MLAVKVLKTSWKAKEQERARKKLLKEANDELRAKIEAENAKRREAMAQSRQRKAENEIRGQVVTTVSDKKLKTMSKKQLRNIRKATAKHSAVTSPQ